MTIDEIAEGADTVLTASLIKLFAAAGCDPTECHACRTDIKEGETFKLVSHKGTDEMCCANCGLPQLKARDNEYAKHRAARIAGGHGGFSRPSRSRINGSDWSPGGFSRPSKEKS